jgi:methyltransferase (TIGR00027 family)
MAVLPGVSALALRLVAGPVLLGHRVTGYVPKAFRYPFEGEVPVQYEASARQTFIDGVLDREFHAVSQVVVLGAGFDTRAYGRPAGETLRWFEVDTPATQAVKRKALADAGIGPARVTFVSADFRREDWLECLIAAGFDLEQPSVFVWEGVLMYLDRSAVETTFRKIAGVAAGSMVVFDHFTQEPLRSGSLYWRFARAMTRLVGEPLVFGLDSTPPVRDQLSTFLAEQGLALGEHRELGREEGRHRAWAGFAAALVR